MKKKYEEIINKYIIEFSRKQDICFDDWVGEFGEVAWFGDIIYFDIHTIIYDINTNQTPKLALEWLFKTLDNHGNRYINYKSYCMGLRYEHLN